MINMMETRMKYMRIVIGAAFLLSESVGVASAAESSGSDEYHSILSSKVTVGAGLFRPTNKHSIGAESPDVNSQDRLDTSKKQTTGMLEVRWRFTENWSFKGNYWATSSESRETLTKDFAFQGEVFQAGSFVGTGVDSSITRLFVGRSFNRKPSTDWGVGVGLHWMKLDAFVEGQVLLAGGAGDTGLRNASASAGAPLPNLGIWYMHSWSPKWVLTTRLDWLDVTFEEFSGRMIDASVAINYQMTDHFGVGLAVNAFDLDVDIDGDEWSGGLDTSQYGPLLNLTWSW
jgi:hypothetical protein